MNFLKWRPLCILFLFYFPAGAQDTLTINLNKADSIFLSDNYYLLASKMNMEAGKAQIIQAKLYPNPIFTADLNLYDPENKKVFHSGQAGQKAFQFEQLIILGGKRKTEIEMAKTNSKIAEIEFQQLIRQLKFRLHSDLFSVGQQKVLLSRYNSQLNLLDTLLVAYQVQADKGNIPLKDVVRLKGAYLKLNNDRAELLKDYHDAQNNLQTILQTNSIIDFQYSEDDITNYIKPQSYSIIKEEALLYRPELQISKQDKVLAEQYLKYQKQLAIPDVNLITSYDQRSGAFANQINAGFAISLPFWNKNQGNIRSANFKLKESDYNLKAVESDLIISLKNYYTFYSQAIAEYKKAISLYNDDFEITVNAMTSNFKKQNISIIEFIDFFEAYNEVHTEIARIKTQLVISAEQLNLLIGKDIY